MAGSPHEPRAKPRRPDWLNRERTAKGVICARCKRGHHLDAGKGGCTRGLCVCHCTFPSVRPLRQPPPWTYHADFAECLASLGGARVECRADLTNQRLVWRPKPSLMPLEVRQLVEMFALDLVHVLWPDARSRPSYDYWTVGALDACVCCGGSTALTDPLGWPRHRRCGWLDAIA